MERLTADRFELKCDDIASADTDLALIIDKYRYPPFWSRPNTFESLVQIILEQQVSLASAKSAYLMLKKQINDVTPMNILKMTDQQFKSAYFSRQKTIYVRELAAAINDGVINLGQLADMPDETVRKILTVQKGVGNWTVDVYLIEVLHRPDIFPVGDIAAVRALKEVKDLAPLATSEELLTIAEAWRPYRTIATMLLWHQYLASRGRSEEMIAGS